MLRERYQASIPQHSAVLIRPHRCRKGHGWEKHKLRGVFNSEIFLISMQTPAQTQPGRLCTASWARPDSFRFPRSSPSGDSAPRSPPPPGPHLPTDPEGPPEGTASPGLAEAQSVLKSRPGPPGSGPAGTPFATSAPSEPPPVSPRPPPPRLRACPGRSRVPRSPQAPHMSPLPQRGRSAVPSLQQRPTPAAPPRSGQAPPRPLIGLPPPHSPRCWQRRRLRLAAAPATQRGKRRHARGGLPASGPGQEQRRCPRRLPAGPLGSYPHRWEPTAPGSRLLPRPWGEKQARAYAARTASGDREFRTRGGGHRALRTEPGPAIGAPGARAGPGLPRWFAARQSPRAAAAGLARGERRLEGEHNPRLPSRSYWLPLMPITSAAPPAPRLAHARCGGAGAGGGRRGRRRLEGVEGAGGGRRGSEGSAGLGFPRAAPSRTLARRATGSRGAAAGCCAEGNGVFSPFLHSKFCLFCVYSCSRVVVSSSSHRLRGIVTF